MEDSLFSIIKLFPKAALPFCLIAFEKRLRTGADPLKAPL
jgi:hypothetical protein